MRPTWTGCDLEITIHAAPKGNARQHLYVKSDGSASLDSAASLHTKPAPPADLHGFSA